MNYKKENIQNADKENNLQSLEWPKKWLKRCLKTFIIN